MSEHNFPARWGAGQHDDTPRFWLRTFLAAPGPPYFGGIRGDVYLATPDEFGNFPELFVGNVAVTPDETFRGFMLSDAWYPCRRPNLEGPINYNDRFITSWFVQGEGSWFAVATGQGGPTISLDGASFGLTGPWTIAGEGIFAGEKIGCACRPEADPSRQMTNFIRQCPPGAET